MSCLKFCIYSHPVNLTIYNMTYMQARRSRGGGGWGLSKYFGEASASPLFHFEFTAINRVNSEFSTRHYRYADVLFNALIHIIAKTLLVKICSHRRPLDEIHFLSCNVHNIHTCIYKYISNSFILVESLSSDLT